MAITNKEVFAFTASFVTTLVVLVLGVLMFNQLMALAEVEAEFDRQTYSDELEGYKALMLEDERNRNLMR